MEATAHVNHPDQGSVMDGLVLIGVGLGGLLADLSVSLSHATQLLLLGCALYGMYATRERLNHDKRKWAEEERPR